MPSFSSFSALALVLSILCPSVLSRVQRLDNAFEPEENEKRDVCYDDDTLQSFKYWIIDSEPYFTATTTVPAVTIISTTFVPTATPVLERRQDTAPAPATTEAPFYQQNPYAYEVINDDGASNASIAATYYSACRCLYLTSSTVTEFDTFSVTRTISGVDSRQTTSYFYVTSGTTTITATRNGSPSRLTTVSSTVYVQPTPISTGLTTLTLGTGTGYPSGGLPSGTGSISEFPPYPTDNVTIPQQPTSESTVPTLNTTISPPSPSGSPTSSSNSSISSQPTSGFPTNSANSSASSIPSSGFPTNSANSSASSQPSSGIPTNSANSSASSIPSSGFPTNSANSSATSITASGVPYPSSNGTITAAPTSGLPLPSGNSTFLTLPSQGFPTTSANQSAPPRPTSGFPFPPSNTTRLSLSLSFQSPATPSVSPSYATLSGASTETFTFPGSESTTASTSAITTITYLPSTVPSPTDGSPTIVPSLEPPVCPGLDGTTIDLTDGQQFAVVCETDYGGPVSVGLIEDSFQDCVLSCATANNGFSAVRCRGVTYYRDTTAPAQNCFFKNLGSLDQAVQRENAVSAVLINVPQLNTTIAPPTSFPTARPNAVRRRRIWGF
ncbi:MAG: hypothetical protein Q9183_001686 [Haloplaca sp. 2 TL-2023]